MVPEQEDSPTDPFRIALGGYAYRARSRAPSGKEIRPSLTRPQLLPGARGLPQALGSRSTAPPGPAKDASQGPGTRIQALGYRCPGPPWRRSQGMSLPTAPSTGSCPGRDTRRQRFPRPLGARGLPGPHVSPRSRPLSPPRRLQKASPEGGWSKPTPFDTQSVRTEQPDDAQASSAPRHHDGPCRTAARPSWTPAHVDRRLEPSNRLVPDLSHYIRDKIGPRGEMIPDSITRHSIPFHPPPLCIESKATRRGAPRTSPPPHPAVSFLSDEGETPLAAR
jgi:hypothetical protein